MQSDEVHQLPDRNGGLFPTFRFPVRHGAVAGGAGDAAKLVVGNHGVAREGGGDQHPHPVIIGLIVELQLDVDTRALVRQRDAAGDIEVAAALAVGPLGEVGRQGHTQFESGDALPRFMGDLTGDHKLGGVAQPLVPRRRVVILVTIIGALFQREHLIERGAAQLVQDLQSAVVIEGDAVKIVLQQLAAGGHRLLHSRLIALDMQSAVTHGRQRMADLDVVLHKGIVVAVVNDLSVHQPRINLALGADEVGDRLARFIAQGKGLGANADAGVDHLLTGEGHQVEQAELVGHLHAVFAQCHRHVVDNLAHVEADQVLGHVVGQNEAGHHLLMHLVAAAAADAVVGVVLHDLLPHLLQ